MADKLSVRDRVALWLGSSQLKAAMSEDEGSIESILGLLQKGTAPTKGTAELMKAYRETPWLRSVTHLIARAVAEVPWYVYAAKPKGKGNKFVHRHDIKRATLANRERMRKELKASGDYEALPSHPLNDFFEAGNMLSGVKTPGMSVRHVAQVHLDLKGEAFLAVERGAKTLPTQLWPIPPNWVKETPTAKSPNYKIDLSGLQREFQPQQITWLRDPDPSNPWGRGSGFGESLGDEIDSDEYAAKMVKSFFYNGALPDAIVALKGADADSIEEFRERWQAEHRGYRKSNMVKFTNAELDVQVLTRTFRELEITSLREFYRNTLHQIFGVPPELLGIIENSNRATIEAAAYLFARWVLVPRLERWRWFYQEIADTVDDRILVDYESPVPQDREFNLKVMSAAPWAFTVNQWQAAAGEDGFAEDGDRFMQSLAMVERPVGQPIIYEPPPPAPKRIIAPRTKGNPTLDELEQVWRTLEPDRLVAEVDPLWREELEAWGNGVLTDLGAAGSFSMINPLVTEHLREFSGKKIVGINDTTREALKATFEEAVRQGEGAEALAMRVQEVFAAADRSRALTIARTEVGGSAGFGTWQAQAQSGVVDKRYWLTIRDGNERDEHGELDGQIRGINQPFTVNGSSAMHVGGFGDPALDINCRCDTPAYFEDTKMDEESLTKAWKAFEVKRSAWERRGVAALRRAFRDQLRDTLAVLDRIA